MAVMFQRVLSDDELHKRVRAAFGSGRKVYTRVGGDRDIGRMAARLRSDKNAQAALSAFLDDLVAASGRLRAKPKKRRRARTLIVVSSGAAVSTVAAAASGRGRFKAKPKKRNRLRTTMMLVSSAAGVSTVVVIRRRRRNDKGIVATDVRTAPADFSPTQAEG